MFVEVGFVLALILVLLHVFLLKHYSGPSLASKIQEELQEEENEASVLLRQKAFNEKCCLRCCATFNFIFKKRLLCVFCHFYVCRDCATWNPVERVWFCKYCEKKRIWQIQSTLNKNGNHLPESIRSRSHSSSSSSSKANPLLTKVIGDSESDDLDNDSGYDPSLSVCSRGSSIRALPPMKGLFNGPAAPNCPPTDQEGNLLLSQCSDLSLLKEEEISIDPQVLEIREHIEALVEKIINGNLDNTKLHHLYNHPEYWAASACKQRVITLAREFGLQLNYPPFSCPVHGGCLYDRMFHTYHGRLSEALTQLGYSLHMAITNQPLAEQEIPTCTHSVLKEVVCEILEEAMGLPPLSGADTGYLATSSPNFSNDDDLNDVLQTQSYEEILATAILNKIIDHHQSKHRRKEPSSSHEDIRFVDYLDNGLPFQMEHQRLSNKEIQTEDETEAEEGLRSRSFHSNLTYSSRNSDVGSESAGEDFSWADGTKGPVEYTIEEQIEEITTTVEESESDSEKSRKRPTPLPRRTIQEPTITKTLVTNNMTLADLDFLYSELDFSQAYKVPFPELGLDIVEKTSELLDNDECFKDISILISTNENWKDNWLFRKKAILQAYRNMRGRMVTCTDPVPMLIPNPLLNSRTRIGSRDIDELSEMSERNSVTSIEYFSTSDESDDNDIECSSLTLQQLQHISGEIVSEFSPKDQEYTESYVNNTRFSFELDDSSSEQFNGDSGELNNLNRPESRPVPLPRKTRSSNQAKLEAQSTSSVTTTAVTTVTSALSITLQTPNQNRISNDRDSTKTIPAVNNVAKSDRTVNGVTETNRRMESEVLPSIKFVPPAARGSPLQGIQFSCSPSNTTVHQGRIVRFLCVIDAKIPYSVAWFFGMEHLQNNEHYQIFQSDNKAFLHIYETDINDQGTYSCVIYNQNGQVWTDFRLTVRGTVQPLSSPCFTESLQDEVSNEGESVRLMCKVSGHPEPKIYWYRNGLLLQSEEKYKSENLHRGQWLLHISDVTINDQGDYSAKAVNRIGEAYSSAYVRIVPPGTKALQTLTKRVNNAQDEVHVEAEKLLKSANQLDQIDHTIGQLEACFQECSWEECQAELQRDSLHIHRSQENASSALRQITGQALDIVCATNYFVGANRYDSSSLIEDSPLPPKPGTIAEREHQKWLKPTANIPNNPYSPENLAKRVTAAKNLEFSSKSKLSENSTHDLVLDEIPHKIDCGLKSIDSTRYKRDYYINEKQQQRGFLKTESNPRSNHGILPEVNSSDLNNIEEKVYLAAGKMSNLKDKLRVLEFQIDKVTEDTPSRKVADLEDRVAHAAAQITQNEKQVSGVEAEVARMKEVIIQQECGLKLNESKAHSRHFSSMKKISSEENPVTSRRTSLTRSKSLTNRAVSMENLNHSSSSSYRPLNFQKKLSKNLSASVSRLDQTPDSLNGFSSYSASVNQSVEDLPSLPSVKELASRFQSIQQTADNLPHSSEKRKNVVSVVNIFPQSSSQKQSLEMESKNVLTVGKKMNKFGKHQIEVTDETQSDSGCGLEISTNHNSSEGINSFSVRELTRKFSLDDAASSSSEGRMEQETCAASSVRRVHSLTARSLSKEFREQARRNLPRQLNRHISISMDDSESSSPSGLPSPDNFYSTEKYPRRSSAGSRKNLSESNSIKRSGSSAKNYQWLQSPDTDGHGYTSDESNTSTGSLLHRQSVSNSILRRAAYWDRRVEEGLTSDASFGEDFSQAFAS